MDMFACLDGARGFQWLCLVRTESGPVLHLTQKYGGSRVIGFPQECSTRFCVAQKEHDRPLCTPSVNHWFIPVRWYRYWLSGYNHFASLLYVFIALYRLNTAV